MTDNKTQCSTIFCSRMKTCSIISLLSTFISMTSHVMANHGGSQSGKSSVVILKGDGGTGSVSVCLIPGFVLPWKCSSPFTSCGKITEREKYIGCTWYYSLSNHIGGEGGGSEIASKFNSRGLTKVLH